MNKTNPNTHKKKFLTRKKKLCFAAALSFCFGLATSVTATYAWYNTMTVGVIEGFNLKFSTSTYELKLGIKDESGKIIYPEGESSYDEEDVGASSEYVLGEVSGMFSSEWKDNVLDVDSLLPTFRSSYLFANNYTKSGLADREAYFQQEFYIRANEDCSIFLSEGSYLESNEELNKKTAEAYGLDPEKLAKSVNATRISIMTIDNDRKINYKILTPTSAPRETYYGGVLSRFKRENSRYYDYIDDKEILFGEYTLLGDHISYVRNPSIEEQIQARGGEIAEDEFSCFTAYHNPNVYGVDLSSVTIAKEDSSPMSDYILKKDQAVATHAPLFTLDKDEDKRVIVSIYLEGWDLDMIDSIARASMNVSLNFAALFDRPS